MTTRSRGQMQFELAIMLFAVVSLVFRFSQWRLGAPDVTVVTVVALALVPLAVRTQVTISRGETNLTLGVSATALFASDVTRQSTILPIWGVLVALSYLAFHRDDETWGLFRAAIQILGGAALLRVAQVADVGFGPFDRVFAGLASYFVVITVLELLRRGISPEADEGRALRLRWTWTFVVGLAAFYIGCVLAAARWLEAGDRLPLVPSFVVVMVGLVAIGVGQAMRIRELHRSVQALSGASAAMPWRAEEIEDALGLWGKQGLRAEAVRVQDEPGARRDVSVPLADGRQVVAQRSSGDLPFTHVERHVLEALANMANTSRRESTHLDELRDRANTDGLTGLPTYTYFREVLAEVSRSRRPGESIAIVFIDLDGFKEINDRFGHIAGDTAIQVLAGRLIRHTQDTRSVTRYGGDEFAVLVRDVVDYAALTEECARLTSLVSEPILVGQSTMRLRASIGSALSSSPDDNLEELVRAADQQMYQRKRAVHAGDGEVTSRIDEAVRRAILDSTIFTAFQPIVNVRSDEVKALEALVRCTDPQLGSIPPPVIVESAIRLNMLDDMTTLVLDQSIATMRRCREVVSSLETVTINLELEQMMTWTPLLDRLASCRRDHGITVVVEISERSIGDWSDANAHIARRLQDAGAQIAIDDFGSGFAGLGSLYLPRVDIVKLDRSLLTDLDDPRQTLVVTRATSMLNELGFWVVAEGITSRREEAVLRDAGATHVQGYLYGMPADSASTIARFRDHGLATIVETSIATGPAH